jgi:hypothetical protein
MQIAKWISDNSLSCDAANRSTGRDAQLDLVRGVAVSGMFFFSFVGTLSDSLPSLLIHNVPGRLLVGDFVLSLFLFCSGISLAMMLKRYGSLYSLELWRKLSTRLSQMLLVSLFITPFSAGAILGMDEMMLNAVLTLPALLVISLGSWSIWSGLVLIWLSHTLLVMGGVVPSLPAKYLGGYALSVFWLPIILGGAIVWPLSERELGRQFGLWAGLLVMALVFCGAPDKLSLSASFGVLSVFVGVFLLFIFRRYTARCRWLEYFGSKPLRMWFLMFVLLGPIRLYAENVHKRPVLSRSTFEAVLISITWMACCYWLSKGWDRISARLRCSV